MVVMEIIAAVVFFQAFIFDTRKLQGASEMHSTGILKKLSLNKILLLITTYIAVYDSII